MITGLPDGVLLAFYGDDFTGSTDAMEVMAFAGLKTVLFTRTPTPEDLASVADYQIVGVAGTSRARSPEWMDENLPTVFERLSALRPAILHYKVCSTFDSSPEIGSIGRAIDIGMRVAGDEWSPCIVGAPQLKRWQVFGNLFAGAGGVGHRIDRHPTMSRHPVTPMREGDLRLHLARQTARQVEGIDFPDLALAHRSDRIGEARRHGSVVFLDVLDDRSQIEAGSIVWNERNGMLFTASSSGLQYALVAHWRALGLLKETDHPLSEAQPVDRILVLSGSCSPATAEQIERAEASGFAGIRMNVLAVVDQDAVEAELRRIVIEAKEAFGRGASVVVYAAKTVDDESFGNLQEFCRTGGVPFSDAQAAIGSALGAVAERLVGPCGLRRILAAGGDTSGRVMGSLPVTALEAAHPFAPGAPRCRAHAEEPAFAGLEIILKGGQVSGESLFLDARKGLIGRP